MAVGIVKKSAFLRMARDDPRMTKLGRMRESGVYSIDTEALIKELEGMHSSRQSRTIKARTMLRDTETSMNMVLENQAFRSRVVQIKITCYKTKALLDEQLSLMTKYLLTKFASQLSLEFSTQKAKADAVATCLSDFSKLQSKLAIVMTISDMIANDLDQSYWSINVTVKIAEQRDKIREI